MSKCLEMSLESLLLSQYLEHLITHIFIYYAIPNHANKQFLKYKFTESDLRACY